MKDESSLKNPMDSIYSTRRYSKKKRVPQLPSFWGFDHVLVVGPVQFKMVLVWCLTFRVTYHLISYPVHYKGHFSTKPPCTSELLEFVARDFQRRVERQYQPGQFIKQMKSTPAALRRDCYYRLYLSLPLWTWMPSFSPKRRMLEGFGSCW